MGQRSAHGAALFALSVLLVVPLAAIGAVTGAPAEAADGDDRIGVAAAPGWTVSRVPGIGWEVSWTSAKRLPVTSDRPTIMGPGLDVGAPTVQADGRTVTALVASAPDDPAPVPADLDVVLSGDRLDESGRDGAAPATSGSRGGGPGPREVLDAADPGARGPHAVVDSDYTLDPVRLHGIAEPVEMVGHVVEPAPEAATGPRPLVVLLHGNHIVCYRPDGEAVRSFAWPCRRPAAEVPNHLGYDYLQRTLASHGFATVSIRTNGVIALDSSLDGGAGARATIVRRHLDHWTTMAAERQVDLSRVVLVGHSRGGEGVDRASIEIPLDAPYRIAGQVLLAPTNFASHTAPHVPTVTVLPYCDGDVFDLQGQRFTDVGRDVSPGADTALKSSVLVLGANHNFFNTEWTPGIAKAPSQDDWFGASQAPCGRQDPGRLRAGEQRDVATAYVSAAVELFTDPGGTGGDYLPLFDGSTVTVASIGDADVYSHAIAGGRDVRRPGLEASPTPSQGAVTSLCRGRSFVGEVSSAYCGSELGQRIAPHWTSGPNRSPTRSFLAMSWSAAGAIGGLGFARDPLDLSADRLELRTIVDPRGGAAQIRVRLTDAAGATTVLTPRGGRRLTPLPGSADITKLWAQTVLVDAAGAAPPGVDLTRVVAVELLGESPRGRLYLADVAAAPPSLPAVGESRLPHVDLGTARVVEHDRGRRVAQVPFTVTGEVTEPARFVVEVLVAPATGERDRFVVDLAPGQTSGSVPVGYQGDRLYGGAPVTPVQVTAWTLRGLATGDYVGGLRVVENDPAPEVTVRPLRRRVVEGGHAVFRVSVSEPFAVRSFGSARVVASRPRAVRGTDVPLAWLRGQGDPSNPDRLLSRLGTYIFVPFRAGQRRVDVRVPIARDGVREPDESLTLRFDVAGQRLRSEVTVDASD